MSVIDYHRRMLADRGRIDAFAGALRSVIVPGKTVVADIGAGTGILGFLAAKLGAKKVYLYEQGPIIDVAKKLAAENRLKHCIFIRKHSLRVKSPPQADVVVCETLGNFAYEENIIETMADAKRFLKPGGVMMPSGITQEVAPLIDDRLWKELTVWRDVGFGIEFGAAEEVAFNNVYVRTIGTDSVLSQNRTCPSWDRVSFPGRNASIRKGHGTWDIDQSATIYGFVLWWNAELVPGITVSTSPFAPATHWEQIVLPLREPLRVRDRDRVELSLVSDSHWQVGIHVQWRAVQKRSGKKISDQAYDMERGMV